MCAAPLAVSVGVRAELERVARSGSVSQRAARQARVLLSTADGVANEETARRCGVAPNTVRAWRWGFEAGGLEWLGTVVGGRGGVPVLLSSLFRRLGVGVGVVLVGRGFGF